MIKIKTKLFFNSSKLRRATDTATRRVFSRFGAFVRTTARRSIRKPTKTIKMSKPGQPPRSHTGKLKRFIFFGYDRIRKSVVIGPAKTRGKSKGKAPRTLEHGGSFKGRKIKARPYMGPAFHKATPQLPKLWENSIKK